jgi:malate dehydrogenase (oxaloacetate-decarboxylating)
VIASRPFANSAGTRRITDGMMLAAAHALAEHSPGLKDASAPLLPALRDIRDVAVEIAFAVAREAEQSSLAARSDSSSSASLHSRILASQWFPDYPTYLPAFG